MSSFIFVMAVIVSTIDAFLMARYFRKKLNWNELNLKVIQYRERFGYNTSDWKHNLYYKKGDGTVDYMKVPTRIFWGTMLSRTVVPLSLLVLSAILLIVDHFTVN